MKHALSNRGIIWASIILCTTLYIHHIHSATPNAAPKLYNLFNALNKYKNFHGAVLVAQQGEILLNHAYGMARYSQEIPNTTQTEFCIGSVTKTFTALMIVLLCQQGILRTNMPVSLFLPSFKHGKQITIHHLLTHTSGLPRDYNTIRKNKRYQRIVYKNVEQALLTIKNTHLLFSPGHGYQYSNIGYGILTYIIERATGLSYEDAVKHFITEPLHMHNTGIFIKNNHPCCGTIGYTGCFHPKAILPIHECWLQNYDGAGNLYSSVEDLYRWIYALMSQQLVPQNILDIMFDMSYNRFTKGNAVKHYGYGWYLQQTDYGKEIFHTGKTSSFTAIVSYFQDSQTTIIILANANNYHLGNLKNYIASIVFGKKLKHSAQHQQTSKYRHHKKRHRH
jgi:CubicO group peptidase (beta-lactamase class C family)